MHKGQLKRVSGQNGNQPSLQNSSESERQYERLFMGEVALLSDIQLLAILLQHNNKQENVLELAENLLIYYGGLNGLAQASITDMTAINGLEEATAAELIAALELGQRLLIYRPDKRPIVQSSADAARLMLDMRNLQQEHIRVILLDTARRVIAAPTIYIGTVNAAMLRTAEIYREAITRNAPAIILVHNHPSGDPTPSPEDVQLTRTLIEAGRLLDIILLDHLIIGGTDWRSLKEMRLAF
jgi:DNA repair protein RadC